MNNEFVMFIGPMFGGKTTKLLSAIDRYKYQGRAIRVFKPVVDERYSRDDIVTHWGHKLNATRVKHGIDISETIDHHVATVGDPGIVIAVDEAFMIEGSGNNLVRLFQLGHTVLVSSLQLSSDFTPYKEIQDMLPYATRIELCPAVCSICGHDAYYTKKVGGRSDHAIEVGGSDMYQPRCLKHFINIDDDRK